MVEGTDLNPRQQGDHFPSLPSYVTQSTPLNHDTPYFHSGASDLVAPPPLAGEISGLHSFSAGNAMTDQASLYHLDHQRFNSMPLSYNTVPLWIPPVDINRAILFPPQEPNKACLNFSIPMYDGM